VYIAVRFWLRITACKDILKIMPQNMLFTIRFYCQATMRKPA